MRVLFQVRRATEGLSEADVDAGGQDGVLREADGCQEEGSPGGTGRSRTKTRLTHQENQGHAETGTWNTRNVYGQCLE